MIFDIVVNDQILKHFIPDNLKSNSIPKYYLLQIIKENKPDLYNLMKESANAMKIKRINKRQKEYKITIAKEIIKRIKSEPIKSYSAKERRSRFYHVKANVKIFERLQKLIIIKKKIKRKK